VTNQKVQFRSANPPNPILATLGFGLGVFAFGCGGGSEPAGPAVLASSYDLVSYEGQTLPVTTRRLVANPVDPSGHGYSCDDRLTRVTLEFVTSDSYSQQESRLLVCDDGRPDSASSSVIAGTYVQSAEEIELITDVVDRLSQHNFARLSSNALTVYRREVRHDEIVSTVNWAPLVFSATH